jgi:hypothetical protein
MKAKESWTCEAGIGVDSSGPSPRVILCRQPARLFNGPLRPFQMALCEEHASLATRASQQPQTT